MTCSRCRKSFADGQPQCPHCGERASESASGVFQSSTVLISAGGTEQVYRSMDEVPDRLRNRLLKSTNSPNAATILIADRRGRQEIVKAMRHLPGSGQRKLLQSLLGGAADSTGGQLAAVWKRIIFAAVLALAASSIAFVFLHRW